ncbi:hypothetical protein Tco_0509260 [Tanacetum coccineum]
MYVGWGVTEWYQEPKIIMVNVIPPNHVDDVPVVEPNQHDDVSVVPEPVLEDEDEDPEEEEFEEEEDDMEVDIEEDENESELTYPYEEVDPLNPLPPAFESEPEYVNEVENMIEHEDETVPVASMRVRSSVEQGTAAMERLVKKLGNAEDKVECKKLKKELEEARFSNTFLRMQNERVERDLYWTRVRAHEFYQEMIRRGFVFEEKPNEAINVPIEDEKSHHLSHEDLLMMLSSLDSLVVSLLIMPPKSAPMTQCNTPNFTMRSEITTFGCYFIIQLTSHSKVTDSSMTDYDFGDESSVCSTPLPLLNKLDGAELISRPKSIKSILRSKSTFKAETLKGVIINEPSSTLTKDNKSSSTSKVNSAPAGKLESVKLKMILYLSLLAIE